MENQGSTSKLFSEEMVILAQENDERNLIVTMVEFFADVVRISWMDADTMIPGYTDVSYDVYNNKFRI